MQQAGRFVFRGVGAGVAIALMELLADYSGEPLSRVPFVTSIVLVLALPHSEAARPYAVLVGHACSCCAGFAAAYLLGAGATSSAVGVGLAGFLMLALRAPHPPAGIDAFLIATHDLGLRWAVSPVLMGCILLVSFSLVWSSLERSVFDNR